MHGRRETRKTSQKVTLNQRQGRDEARMVYQPNSELQPFTGRDEDEDWRVDRTARHAMPRHDEAVSAQVSLGFDER